MGCRFVSNVTVNVCSFISIVCAVAVAAITATQLSHYTVTSNADQPVQETQCLLGTDGSNNSLCLYAYTVAGVAILAALAVGLLRCLTCNLCGCGKVLDLVFSALGTAWWVTAALVFTKYGRQANEGLVPQVSWRNSIWVLSWVAVLSFALIFVITLCELMSHLCCSCCSDDDEESGRRGKYTGY